MIDKELEEHICSACNSFHNRIRSTKWAHWRAFLDDVNNIWQAASYLKAPGSSTFARVSFLISDTGDYLETNEEIGEALL